MLPKFKTILVATDFSEASEHALEYAHTLAHSMGGRLHLLHVVPDPVLASAWSEAYAYDLTALGERLRTQAEQDIAKRARSFGDVRRHDRSGHRQSRSHHCGDRRDTGRRHDRHGHTRPRRLLSFLPGKRRRASRALRAVSGAHDPSAGARKGRPGHGGRGDGRLTFGRTEFERDEAAHRASPHRSAGTPRRTRC